MRRNRRFAKLGEPCKAFLKEMIDRKLELYPNENRQILDYEIAGSGENIRVEVIFNLLPREIADLEHGNQPPKAQ